MKVKKIATLMLTIVLFGGFARGQDNSSAQPKTPKTVVLPGENVDINSPALDIGQQQALPGLQDGKRTVKIVEDRNQTYMASKVYKLKHTTGNDLTPFVLGAVKRYNADSSVGRMNYAFKKEQYLVVHTAEQMIPYVDDMIAKLDRPGKKDSAGSIIDGDGIYRFVYYPKYRFDPDMAAIGNYLIGSGDGEYYSDSAVNMFYWKDSKSDGSGVLKWLEVMDRPVPQVDMNIKVYEINNNDIKELGVDWVSWKNGPGAELFGFGADLFSFSAKEQFLGQAANWISQMSSGFGGMMFAPQFDASFIRLLDQKGKAKVYSSGNLTIANDFNGTHHITVSPGYQNISKTDLMEMSIQHESDSTFDVTITNPIICFTEKGEEAGTVMFGYTVTSSSVVERNNVGLEFVNQNSMSSNLTLACGNEKLLGTFTKESDVDQYNGMPFLGDVPLLKYVVGTSTRSVAYTRMCVTVEATPVLPESSLSEWSGKVVTAVEMLRKDKK